MNQITVLRTLFPLSKKEELTELPSNWVYAPLRWVSSCMSFVVL